MIMNTSYPSLSLCREPDDWSTSTLPFELDVDLSRFDDDQLEFHGRKWKPDDFTAYIAFHLSHSLPSVTSYGTALHPGTIARSWETMRHKVFNLGHLMKAYDPEHITRDRILGTLVDVEWTGPAADTAEWPIPAKANQAPGLRCVAALHKLAEGADRIIGAQQGGRVQWQVSMEVRHRLEESAFAFSGPDGWTFVPWTEANDELRACYNRKRLAIDRDFEGRRPVLLMGGVNGRVQYAGVALVPRGAEPTNGVETLFAADHRPLTNAAAAFVASERQRFGLR